MITFFRNNSLNRKLILIILSSTITFTFFTLALHMIIMNLSNEQLYKQIASNIQLSATNLSQRLNTIEEYAHIIVVNEKIQTYLSDQKDINDYTTTIKAREGVNSLINIYADNLYKYGVNYIMVKGFNLEAGTYIPPSRTPDNALIDDLVSISKEHPGHFTLVSKYSSTEGIFLLHSMRRIDGLKFDYLGTLIINIDPIDIIEQSFPPDVNYTDIQFLIYDGDDQVIYPNELIEALEDSADLNRQSYSIIKHDQKEYMSVSQLIFENWTFHTFLPYDSVRKTNAILRNVYVILITIIGGTTLYFTLLITNKRFTQPIKNLIRHIEDFGKSAEPLYFEESGDNNDELTFLSRKFHDMTVDIHALIQDNYKKELLYKEAQLHYLEAQINPHFLYNTLDSISWRAKMAEDQIIVQMTESLAMLYRGNIISKESYSLQDELELVKHYLIIQKFRYGEQLSFDLLCSQQMCSYTFPNMVIQPIVENAIKYSIESHGEACHIIINCFIDDQSLLLEIKNTGSTFPFSNIQDLEQIQGSGFGIGLSNIHHRIGLSYGEAYGLSIGNQDSYAVVSVKIPLLPLEDNYVKDDHCR